jgi:hypothetical protein
MKKKNFAPYIAIMVFALIGGWFKQYVTADGIYVYGYTVGAFSMVIADAVRYFAE